MSAATLLLVSADGCHFCEHAHEVIGRVATDFPVTLSELDWESPDGQALVLGDGALFPPALYLDGRLFGYGRISEGRLRKALAERPS